MKLSTKLGVLVCVLVTFLVYSSEALSTGYGYKKGYKSYGYKSYSKYDSYDYKKGKKGKKYKKYKSHDDDDDDEPESCKPEPPSSNPLCSDCDGKLTNIIFRYDGTVAAFIEIEARKGQDRAPLFQGTVSTGDQFSVSGTDNYLDNKSTLGANIEIRVDGVELGTLHTSCSEPVGPGTIIGDLVVLAATSRNGGQTCPVGPIPDPPVDPCPPEASEFCP